jgi:hypothetical protein
LALEVSKLTKRFFARRAVRTWTSIAAEREVGSRKRRRGVDETSHRIQTSSAHCGGRGGGMQVLDRVIGRRSISEKAAVRQLMENYSKLGFMIHKLWKEWRKL